MRKFYDAIYWLFMTFCKIIFIASILITSYVVFMRFVLSKTPRWGEQSILLCMVYMALISASLAIRTDKHLRVVLIQYAFPERIRAKAMDVLHALSQITIFLFSLFMIVYGVQFTKLMQKSVLSGIPIAKAWLYAAVPVAGVCMLLMQSEQFLLFIFKMMKKPVKGYYNYKVNPPQEDTQEKEDKKE
ncbi:MAG: TRAP transporter small permease [Blautia sp.]|nr:TRAP transporter small permease [Blautia sp.]